jgi:predicted ATPase
LRTALEVLPGMPDETERARQELAIQRVLAPALIAVNGWMMPEAESAYHRARALSEQLDDVVSLASTFYALAFAYEVRGEYEKAQTMLEQHMRILKDAQQSVPDAEKPLLESHELMSCSLYHQGFFTQSVQQADEGLNYYKPAWYSHTLTGHGENAGVGCHLWATLSLWYAGYPNQALERIKQAEEMARLPNHDFSQAAVSTQRGILHQLRGEVEQVADQAAVTLNLAHENGFPYRVATGSILRGWSLAAQGEHEQGITLLREGLDACLAMGALYDYPYYLGLLAEAYAAAGEVDKALSSVAEARPLMQRGRCLFYGAELQRMQGDLLLRADGANRAEAEAHFKQAFEAARDTGAKSLELRAATSLCRLSGAAPDAPETHLLATTYAWFSEGFATADLQRAEALLSKSVDGS